MSYNQIKNTVVPPAKRTAQAAQQVLARLPNTPEVVSIGGAVLAAMAHATLVQPLKNILANPVPYLQVGTGALVGAALIGGPAGVAVLVAAGAYAVITYAVVAAAILAVLSIGLAAITIYDHRVKLAKAIVKILEAL